MRIGVQGASKLVVEWFDSGRYFDHRIANGNDSVSSVSGRENLALNDSAVFVNGDVPHRVAGDLAVQAILDNESAHGYLSAGVLC